MKIPAGLKELRKATLQEIHHLPYLMEGIDIDNANKTVSFSLEHENNVDTSILFNPTYSNINGIDIISIFKRKANNNKLDGNPLIYALKNIKGWQFANPKEDIIGLLKQFIRISEKINSEYDTIITIPSQNPLNLEFLYRLNKIIKAKHKITNYLSKLTADEVYEDFIDWKQIQIDYPNDNIKIENNFNKWFSDMKIKNNDYFSFKYIKDPNMRKYIKKTMWADDELVITYAPYINNKDILILDDTISSGASISHATKEILEEFDPKSITVITLFSALDNQ